MFKFVKQDEISEKELITIKEIWRKNFSEDSDESEMGLLEETVIGMLVEDNESKEEIIAIVFLLNLSEESLHSDNKYYTNIIQYSKP